MSAARAVILSVACSGVQKFVSSFQFFPDWKCLPSYSVNIPHSNVCISFNMLLLNFPTHSIKLSNDLKHNSDRLRHEQINQALTSISFLWAVEFRVNERKRKKNTPANALIQEILILRSCRREQKDISIFQETRREKKIHQNKVSETKTTIYITILSSASQGISHSKNWIQNFSHPWNFDGAF